MLTTLDLFSQNLYYLCKEFKPPRYEIFTLKLKLFTTAGVLLATLFSRESGDIKNRSNCLIPGHSLGLEGVHSRNKEYLSQLISLLFL